MSRRPGEAGLERISAPLRADVRLLSTVLGQVVTESAGQGLLADVERLRKAAIELRAARGEAAAARLAEITGAVNKLDRDRASEVARAFTLYFQLVNLAEERHRVRILRSRSRADVPVRESLAATITQLREDIGAAELDRLLEDLDISLVLTAHPTEARRRAVVEALGRVGQTLDRLDDYRLTGAERADAERRLAEEIAILWRTSQVRQRRPTPLDEVRSAMAVFDESLFRLVPPLYRELQRALGRPPKSIPIFVRWGSWVGGDRDGNPNVTSEVTETALSIQSTHVLLGLEAVTRRIGRSLSLSDETTPPSPAVLEALEAARPGIPISPDSGAEPQGETHRELILLAAERLRATRLGTLGGYGSADQFLADIDTVQESLEAAGAGRIASGELQGLAWQARTFGFHLAGLEVRQHSTILRQALAELAPGGEGVQAASAVTRELIATLRAMAQIQRRHGVEACRRFVVSFTRSSADVAAVLDLARLAVADGSLVVDPVPLFESRADLEAAPAVLDGLRELPAWRHWLEERGRRLEIMLGYSDAAKDAGYLCANLSLYRAQASLAAWARRNRIQLTIFHGRGGAVGRGGGPAGRAIRGQAPGSLGGRFKVTEQGEVVFARYGNAAIALRHLEQVTSAVLVASTSTHQRELAEADRRFEADARLMADASERAYRALVESEGFAEFFAAVTPVAAIGDLPIGSRPARRGGSARGLEELRAIPWVFAWAQSRCNLPGWFGLGTGLNAVVEVRGLESVRRMAADWPVLASILDNAEMSLAKADAMIAGLYLERGGRPDLTSAIREEFRLTRRLVLELTGSDHLLQRHPILRLAVDLRNPYVDALSLLQLRFLDEARPDLVRLTVGGIAAGLQNTG